MIKNSTDLILLMVIIILSCFISFILEVLGLVSWEVSRPWLITFICVAVMAAIVIYTDLMFFIQDRFLRIRLKQIEARHPGSRATELSSGGILLTDRHTGATIGILGRDGRMTEKG